MNCWKCCQGQCVLTVITLYHKLPSIQLYRGFVRGMEGEYPAIIGFKPNYSTGALLVVVRVICVCSLPMAMYIPMLMQVWSSGRISFIPFHFQSPSSLPATTSELIKSHTPSSHPSSLIESLPRPSLNRTCEAPTGTPLYSVFATKI